MARDFLILIFCATIALLLGNGLYASFRSGVPKTIRARRAVRRADEPISYWFGMFLVAFAFVVVAAATVLMGFLVVHDFT